jgi:hypothetical protein
MIVCRRGLHSTEIPHANGRRGVVRPGGDVAIEGGETGWSWLSRLRMQRAGGASYGLVGYGLVREVGRHWRRGRHEDHAVGGDAGAGRVAAHGRAAGGGGRARRENRPRGQAGEREHATGTREHRAGPGGSGWDRAGWDGAGGGGCGWDAGGGRGRPGAGRRGRGGSGWDGAGGGGRGRGGAGRGGSGCGGVRVCGCGGDCGGSGCGGRIYRVVGSVRADVPAAIAERGRDGRERPGRRRTSGWRTNGRRGAVADSAATSPTRTRTLAASRRPARPKVSRGHGAGPDVGVGRAPAGRGRGRGRGAGWGAAPEGPR